MAMDIPQSAQNAKPQEVTNGFTVYPKGEYDAMVTDFKEAQRDNGQKYYHFTISIMKGPHQNGTIALFLDFKSPEGWQRKQSDTHYANLCAATGVKSANGEDYKNKPFRMVLDCYVAKKGKSAGEMKNQITNFLPRHTGPVQPTTQTQAPGSTNLEPVSSPWGSQS